MDTVQLLSLPGLNSLYFSYKVRKESEERALSCSDIDHIYRLAAMREFAVFAVYLILIICAVLSVLLFGAEWAFWILWALVLAFGVWNFFMDGRYRKLAEER